MHDMNIHVFYFQFHTILHVASKRWIEQFLSHDILEWNNTCSRSEHVRIGMVSFVYTIERW
jgi:hypothetical protein